MPGRKAGANYKGTQRLIAAALLRRGKSVREASRKSGLCKATVLVVRREIASSLPETCECGEPLGHRGWCRIRYKKSIRRQLVVEAFGTHPPQPTPDSNPLCLCGCGQEVARPANRFILGHSSFRKIKSGDILTAKELLSAGMSLADIGEIFGVSSATIYNIKTGCFDDRLLEREHPRIIPMQARRVVHQSEIDEWVQRAKDRRDLRTAREALKMLKALLRERKRESVAI